MKPYGSAYIVAAAGLFIDVLNALWSYQIGRTGKGPSRIALIPLIFYGIAIWQWTSSPLAIACLSVLALGIHVCSGVVFELLGIKLRPGEVVDEPKSPSDGA